MVQVGYCQGMNVLLGMLLLILREEDAFYMLDTLVKATTPDLDSVSTLRPFPMLDALLNAPNPSNLSSQWVLQDYLVGYYSPGLPGLVNDQRVLEILMERPA